MPAGPTQRPGGAANDAENERRPLLTLNPFRGSWSPPVGAEEETSSVELSDDQKNRDWRRRRRALIRYLSFASAILNCLCAGSVTTFSLYGHLFGTRLRYTQLQINGVSIAAELSLYLPVSLVGYVCDRYSTAPVSAFSGVCLGFGYLLAAFTYHAGPIHGVEGHGWPYPVMIAAFLAIGLGTCCMYLTSVTTCAKNFGRGSYKGIALAIPIAAYGLSGMLLSQLGSRVLYEVNPDGTKGDVDVYRFFLFLGFTLLATGIIGGFGLRVVDEDELIDEAIEDLERSGLLDDSELFTPNEFRRHDTGSLEESSRGAGYFGEDEEQRKKTWLLNAETSRFLKDHTMWWLAAGFFLVTGPGEAFINNLGTIIGTLNPLEYTGQTTSAATHVSIVAITSTVSRILTGTITDLIAPSTSHHQYGTSTSIDFSFPRSRWCTLSRLNFLLAFSLLFSLGCVALASGFIQNHPERFWLVSGLVGAGYGAVFSLTPIIISVVWGVENFGTNWGIIAMTPALGATFWGFIYSGVYQWATDGDDAGATCHGLRCYQSTYWGMTVSVWIACGLWLWAWRGKGGWVYRGIAV